MANDSKCTHWTRFDTNRDIEAYQSDYQEAPMPNANERQVRHTCHMWIDDDTNVGSAGPQPVRTKPFDFAVNTDLTVVLNGTLVQWDSADPGNIDVDVMGSIDGVNYTKMADLVTWNAGGGGGGGTAEVVGYGMYDVDTYGAMPYMCLQLDAPTDPVMTDGFKITVIPV
jgi:hypothetical protein